MKKEIGLLVLLLMISFVLAAHVVTKVGGNFDDVQEDVSYFYNVSVLNSDLTEDANISAVTIIFPGNFSFDSGTEGSDSSGIFTEGINNITWSGDGVIMNLTTNYFWFNLTGETAGNFNLTVSTTNSSGSETTLLSVSVNDTTNPAVSISLPVSYGNYSRVKSLISTIFDDSIMSAVYFQVINSTGDINGTYSASNPSGNSWNASLNTSVYVGGLYNITFFANDSNGNINNTELVYSVRFDNTNPNIDFVDEVDDNDLCDDYSLVSGDVLHCGCSGSDSGSGVYKINDEERDEYLWNITTSSTGNKYTICTITDYAGNSVSYRFNYTVSSSSLDVGSGGSSGSDNGFWINTYDMSDEDFSDKGLIERKLREKQRIKIKVNNVFHHVGIVDIDGDEVTINVSSTSQQKIFSINDSFKFDVTDDIYYDLEITLNEISGSYANISIVSINEEIPEELRQVNNVNEGGGSGFISSDGESEDSKKFFDGKISGTYFWISLVIFLVLIIFTIIYFLVIKGKLNFKKTSLHVKKSDWR